MTVLKYVEKSTKALALLALTLVVLSGITVSAQEHSDPRSLSAVNGNRGTPSIGVPENDVTSTLTHDVKTALL